MRTITRNWLALPAFALASALSACGGGDNGGGNGGNGNGSPTTDTDVRFLNLLDSTSNPVDIYLQSDLDDPDLATPAPILSGVARGDLSDTIQLPARTTSFFVVDEGADPRAGGTERARAIAQNLEEDVRNLVVLFLVGDARTIQEDLEAPAAGTRYRFVHISENYTGSVQLFDANDNVSPETIGSSISLGSSQDLELTAPEGDEYILGLGGASDVQPDIVFPLPPSPGQAFYAFIQGEGSDMGEILLLAPDDARSTIASMEFMEPGEGRINVVNLADDTGPQLSLFANDEMAAIASVPFGSASTPRELLEGSYDFVVEDDAGNEVASLDGFDLEPGDFFTFVIYDTPNGEVTLRALEEDSGTPPVGQSRIRIIHIAPDLTTPIDLLDAGAMPPVALPNGFQGVGFGDVSPALNRTGGLELGIDADDRPDLEFRFNSPTLDAGRVVNLFIDSQEDLGELTVRLVPQPINGSTQPAITGSVVPDPSFVRGIHLGLLQPSVDFFESSNQFSTPAQSNIQFEESGMGYVEVDADDSAQVLFTPPGQQGTVLAQGSAEFGVDESQTVAFFGTSGNYRTGVYVDDLMPAPGPGTVRLRLINTAVAVGSISGTFEGQNLGSNLGLGDAGPYVEVAPGAEPQLTLQTGQTVTLTLPNVTGGRVYNVFFVNDQQNGQQFVVTQDDNGNTESVFRPADVRVLNLLSDPMGENVAMVSLGNSIVASDVPQNSITQVTEVQEGSFPALCALNSGFTAQGNVTAAFGDLTTVICQGFSQASGGVFSAIEKPASTAAVGDIEWRFANFATNFPQSGAAVDVTDPTDPMNPFAVGVTPNRVPPTFLTGSADGFPIVVETNPGTPDNEQVVFEIPPLPDQTAYTFYVSRAPNPMTLGPVELVIVSSDPSAEPITVGPIGTATIFHASPGVAPIDVFASQDPTAIATNLAFGQNSMSLTLEGGQTRFDVALTGDSIMDSIFDFTDQIVGRADNTVVLFGEDMVRGAVFENPDQAGGGGPNDVDVRVLHTASELGQVDLYDVATGQLINSTNGNPNDDWEDLNPGQATAFTTVDSNMPITVGIDVEETNSGLTGASVPAYDYYVDLNFGGLGLTSGTANVVLVQDAANNDLSFRLQLTDSAGSVLTFGPSSRVRLVNASGQDASVDLFINGFAASTGSVNAGVASEWEPVFSQSNQTLDIVPSGQMPGPSTTLASLSSVTFEPGRSYTIVYNRAGGGPNILALDDNYADLGSVETRVRFVHAGPGFGQVDVYDASAFPPDLLAENLDEGTASAPIQIDPTTLPMMVPLAVDQDDDPSTLLGATVDAQIFDPGNFLHIVLFTNGVGQPQGLVLLSDGFQDTETVQ
jgi:hypothetical protein